MAIGSSCFDGTAARAVLAARMSWIAAGLLCDIHRNEPGVFERGGEHAGATLTEVIVAAAAIDPPDARLAAHAAAKARRTRGRADDLGPECRGDDTAGHGCGGAARPPAVRSPSRDCGGRAGSVAANSVVTTLPRSTALASRSTATLAAPRPVRQPPNSDEPCSVGMSASR